jgi:hypothetical protein
MFAYKEEGTMLNERKSFNVGLILNSIVRPIKIRLKGNLVDKLMLKLD